MACSSTLPTRTILLALCFAVCGSAALAAETGNPRAGKSSDNASANAAAKALPNPTVNVEVTEWAVFVADVVNPTLNARNLFSDPLPSFAEDLRTASSDDHAKPGDPAPLGLIRLSADGPIDKTETVDVQLSFNSGRLLGHWPTAKTRSAAVLWKDLGLATDTTATERRLPEGSWLAPLRSGSLPLLAGGTRESFLLYDLELPYQIQMHVSRRSAETYSVSQSSSAALLDVTFYKPDTGHWRTAMVSSLASSGAGAMPAAPDLPAAVATSNSAYSAVQIVRANGAVVTMTKIQPALSAASAPAATGAKKASAAPKPAIAAKPTEFVLGPATETDDTVLAPWRGKLAAAGLAAADQDAILKILARHALDPKRLTAVCRLDPAELDRIVPLEVVPQPKKITRVALVIVRGIDPAIDDDLDRLIKKLGDPSWKVRDAATKEIHKFGVRAKSRLETAANDKDVEISYRAEMLLAGIGKE
ncbi:MAG TPA: hypothetical protein VHX65_04185 [Pirellulales bacterium]|jgi:hypothetical protein|nr:hypothetical protein [Pirellulales bacterium]